MRTREVAPPAIVVEQFEAMELPPPHVFETDNGYQVFVSREPLLPPKGDLRWHVSVSHPNRLPKWDDLVELAHRLRPGVCFVVGVPPRSWWLNIHPNCLHLWETKDDNLEDQWRAERQGHTPT